MLWKQALIVCSALSLWIHTAFPGTGRRQCAIIMSRNAQQGCLPMAHVYLLTSFLSSLLLFLFPWVARPSLNISDFSILPFPFIQHPHGLLCVASWLWSIPTVWYWHYHCLKLGDIFHLPSPAPGTFLPNKYFEGRDKFSLWPFASLWTKATPPIIE